MAFWGVHLHNIRQVIWSLQNNINSQYQHGMILSRSWGSAFWDFRISLPAFFSSSSSCTSSPHGSSFDLVLFLNRASLSGIYFCCLVNKIKLEHPRWCLAKEKHNKCTIHCFQPKRQVFVYHFSNISQFQSVGYFVQFAQVSKHK